MFPEDWPFSEEPSIRNGFPEFLKEFESGSSALWDMGKAEPTQSMGRGQMSRLFAVLLSTS